MAFNVKMDNFARIILNNAQTSYDGGIFRKILQHVKLLNNTQLKEEVMPYLTSVRLSGGYFAGLFFGLLWITALIIVMAVCCYLHFTRKRSDFNRVKMFRPLKLKNEKMGSYSNAAIVQLFVLGAMVIPVVLLVCLSVVNITRLSYSITEPANHYVANNTQKVNSLLPAMKKSLHNAREYLTTFASNARIDTASTVDDIIEATRTMQNDTTMSFNSALMGRIGVTETFRHGDEMTEIVVKFFEQSKALVVAKNDYEQLRTQLYPNTMNPESGVFRLVGMLRDSISQLALCDSSCAENRAFFGKSFQIEDSFANTEFASSFLFVMAQRNETRESVIEKSAHGRREMDATVRRTKQRMDSMLDIAGTVRNMTGATWTKMDEQMQEAVVAIDRIDLVLSSERVSSIANTVSLILVIVFQAPLLIAAVVVVLAVLLVCDGARSSPLRGALYASLALISLSLVLCMATFLLGGNLETELCRYLRTEQPIIVSSNGSSLVLDKDINIFLGEALKTLPKSEFPVPTPHNALYGLLHKCRDNAPILEALDAIKSVDTRALSKPEASEKIIAIGRMLLMESLNETDPRKMMPSDMQETLNQASQMDMFKNIDIDANIARIPHSPLRELRNNVSSAVSLNVFIDRVEKFISIYGPQFKNQEQRETLDQEFRKLLRLFERFTLITDKTRELFRGLRSIPKIEPVVTRLQASLLSMLSLMNNKTQLLSLANKYYDELVVKTTPHKTALIMAKYGPRMMSKLGPCRPLFEAYQSTIDTTCDVVVSRINVYWLYLGTIVLLLTIFLATILTSILRTVPWTAKNNGNTVSHINLEKQNSANKPLVDPASGDIDDSDKLMV